MITPLHVLLKDDPRLEGDVADDKADPSVGLQLNQISVLQYFLETAGFMDHRHVLSSCYSDCTVLEGWQVAGDLVPQEAPDIS